MTPFTKDEMIRVANAAGLGCENYLYNNSTPTEPRLFVTDNKGNDYLVAVAFVYEEPFFKVKLMNGRSSTYFNILSVADTIREILKEREG